MGQTSNAADLILRPDWHDNLEMRQQVLKQWAEVPRQQQDVPEPPVWPEGAQPCPSPGLGRHVFQQGHFFTEDGYCWIPADPAE